jgi:hypothetical protein
VQKIADPNFIHAGIGIARSQDGIPYIFILLAAQGE